MTAFVPGDEGQHSCRPAEGESHGHASLRARLDARVDTGRGREREDIHRRALEWTGNGDEDRGVALSIGIFVAGGAVGEAAEVEGVDGERRDQPWWMAGDSTAGVNRERDRYVVGWLRELPHAEFVVPAVRDDSPVREGAGGRGSPFCDGKDRCGVGSPYREWPACSERPEDANSGGVSGEEVLVVAQEGERVDRLCVATEDVSWLEWRVCTRWESFWWGHLVLAC